MERQTIMNIPRQCCALGLLLSFAIATAIAGPLDPNCTAEKAAKSTAAKATVGVGGRCDPKEAAHDTAKDTADLGDKGKNKNDKERKDKNKDKDRDKN